MSAPITLLSRLSAPLAVLVRFAAAVQKAQERRKVIHTLASLDDHMLRDIGLNRCDVDSVLAESALTDGTLILADRVLDTRRHQRALVREAKAWTSGSTADNESLPPVKRAA